jgi:hypothetical protein
VRKVERDWSTGEVDERRGGVGGVEPVGAADDQLYLVVECLCAGVAEFQAPSGEDTLAVFVVVPTRNRKTVKRAGQSRAPHQGRAQRAAKRRPLRSGKADYPTPDLLVVRSSTTNILTHHVTTIPNERVGQHPAPSPILLDPAEDRNAVGALEL